MCSLYCWAPSPRDSPAGFGYACSEDGLVWSPGMTVAVPGGARTPFGLIPLTAGEQAARRADVLAAGVLNASTYNAANTSLQWGKCPLPLPLPLASPSSPFTLPADTSAPSFVIRSTTALPKLCQLANIACRQSQPPPPPHHSPRWRTSGM